MCIYGAHGIGITGGITCQNIYVTNSDWCELWCYAVTHWSQMFWNDLTPRVRPPPASSLPAARGKPAPTGCAVLQEQVTLSKKLQAKTAGANLHLFITKADQVLSNKPTVLAMSLCKHEEADTSVSSTWNMPLIRGTIKPTLEQWTHVWLSLPSCDFGTA